MRKNDKDAGGNRARIWKIASMAFLVAAIVCTVVACAGKAKQEDAEDQYESLAEQTTKVVVEETPEPSAESSEGSEASEEEPEEDDFDMDYEPDDDDFGYDDLSDDE